MMIFLIASLLSAVFFGVAVLIESQLSNRTFKHPTTMIFYISLMNAVFLPLVLFVGLPTIPSVWAFGCYVILAAIDVVYLYPFYMSMKVIDTSIVAALFSLGKITIPFMTFLLLGEKLFLEQYIGFVIIVLASVALSIKGNRVPKLNKAFWYMLFASFLRAFYVVLEKYVLEIDDNWINMVIYPSVISGLMPFAFLLFAKWRKDIVKNFPPYVHQFGVFAINEFLCFVGGVCVVYGLSGISAVVSTAITSTQPIFMLAISYFLLKKYGIPLKEKISVQVLEKKLFCFVLIILGVILVTAG